MKLTHIDNYSKLISDMKRVLETEPRVHVPENMIKNNAQAVLVARDLDLLLEYDEVDCKYYFTKRTEKSYAC